MSARNLPRLAKWVPLWKRVIPTHPKYVKGNPQQRIYLPIYWMKLLRPEETTPKEISRFEVHPQMTKSDIKQYLEKMYQVDVLSIMTASKKGDEKTHPVTGYVMERERDMKYAYVHLKETFEFPEIFKQKQTEIGRLPEEYKTIRKTEEKRNKKEWPLNDIPSWFR